MYSRMAKTGIRGITFDARDNLYDAQFQRRGQRYRKKFKTIELARRWMESMRAGVLETERRELMVLRGQERNDQQTNIN